MLSNMLTRRKFAMGAVGLGAVAVAGCSGTGSNVTIAAIIAAVQSACGFVLSTQSVINIVISFVANFDASLGAAATVAANIAAEVENAICSAVKTATETPALKGAEPGTPLTIIVNGVQVTGQLVGKPSVQHH